MATSNIARQRVAVNGVAQLRLKGCQRVPLPDDARPAYAEAWRVLLSEPERHSAVGAKPLLERDAKERQEAGRKAGGVASGRARRGEANSPQEVGESSKPKHSGEAAVQVAEDQEAGSR